MPVTSTSRLLLWLMPPPLGAIASLALKLQRALWRTRPGLVERLSDFVPIGIASIVIQLAVFMLRRQTGMDTLWATFIAVQASVLSNFAGHRLFTWRGRFAGWTTMRSVVWFVPLLLIFVLTTPILWMKTIGITSLRTEFGVPPVVSRVMFEEVGAVANYLSAATISFGLVAKVLGRITPDLSPTPVSWPPRSRGEPAPAGPAIRRSGWSANGDERSVAACLAAQFAGVSMIRSQTWVDVPSRWR